MSALFKWLAAKIQKYIEHPDSTGYITAAELEKYALKLAQIIKSQRAEQ